MAEAAPVDDWERAPPVSSAPTSDGADDWERAPAPPESAQGTQGISDRLSKGFQPAGLQSYVLRKLPDIASDTAEFFKEGVHQTVAAVTGEGPSQLEDLRPEVEKQLISIGRTPEIAKLETEQLMRSWRRQERIGGAVMGPLTALTAPMQGAYRALFSRPLEEVGGPPKEVTEMFGMVGLTVFGLPEMSRAMARVKVTPDGKVSAQAVGALPKDADFKTAAELISRDVPAVQEPERVVQAAYKIGDEIFKAPIHALAVEDAMAKFGVDREIKLIDMQPGANLSEKMEVHNRMNGFVTSTGRFVERKEAQEIANRQEQLREGKGDRLGGLNAEDIKDSPAEEVFKAWESGGDVNKVIADFKARSETVEQNLRTLWDERGIHPAEALHDAQSDAWLKHELTQPPIEAFHGSRHDFEVFSNEKIGTGQGAQVYGHGLYFAENREVAHTYLGEGADATVAGMPYNPENPTHFASSLIFQRGSKEAALAEARKQLAHDPEEFKQRVVSILERDTPPPIMEVPAHMYKVRIHADLERMLDYDKTLDKQSPHILSSLERLRDMIKAESPYKQSGLMLDALLGDKNKALQKVLDATKDLGAKTEESKSLAFDDFYRQFAKYDFDQISAAEMMRQAGIPGIKYLDQQSRLSGKGTNNFVIFDDSAIQIIEKNGQPFYDQRFKQAVDARDARIIQGLEEAPPIQEPAAPHPDRPLGEALKATDELRAANRDFPDEDRAILGEFISGVRMAASKRQLSVEGGATVKDVDVPFPKVRIRDIPETGGQQAFILKPDGAIHDLGELKGGHLQAIGDMAQKEGIEVATSTEGGKYPEGQLGIEEYQRQRGLIGVTRFNNRLGFNIVETLTKQQLSTIREMAKKLGSEESLFSVTDRNGRDISYSTDIKDLQKFVDADSSVVMQGDRFRKAPLAETAPADHPDIVEHAWLEADQDLARAQAAMARIDEVKARHPELAGTIDKAVQAVEDTLAQRDAMRPSRAVSRIKVEVTKNEGFRDSWRAENEFGWIGASVDPGKGLVEIQASNLKPGTPIGKGYGTELYKAIIDKGLDEGYVVESSRAVSEDARNLYEGLRRKGYTVETVNPEGMKGPRAPVYRITGGPEPRSLGAAATDPPLTPLSVQPRSPAGSLVASAQEGIRALFDISKDIQMKVAPMATGTRDSILAAKDFASTMRKNRWDWARVDDFFRKTFNDEQDRRMFNAMDEESVALQKGESREHQGLTTLEPQERAAVEAIDDSQQRGWLKMMDLGMVKSEGIPMHATRALIGLARAKGEMALSLDMMGQNLTTRTPFMRHRKYLTVEETEAAAKAKYGEEVSVARSMRAVIFSIAKMEDAIAGRELVNKIQEYGKASGNETVSEGTIPADSEHKWFTIDHPALKTWRPRFEEVDGKVQVVKDADGGTVFDQVPIYIRDDFEGPLRAVLEKKSGATYQALMALKGKTTSVIMYTPAIHNLVELGRAFPAMPTRIIKAYFDGNRAKNDPAIMHEAIDSGLVPIGKRFFNQDLDGLLESPDLTAGRSWTAKVLAAVPGLFDKGAELAVKKAVDKAGDFWHNTLLWDRIGDLQTGLYTNLRGDLMAKGVDQATSSIVAAHWANRYAGAIPQEAMSSGARKVSNFFFFSRSFTMGNLGVMKDMLTGMPKDTLAMVERAGGFKEGSIGSASDIPQVGEFSKGLAARKAMMIVALDIGLLYVGNSILQSILNVMLGDRTIDEEAHGYTRRFKETLNNINMHPSELFHPFRIAESLTPMADNEPGKKDRVMIGRQSDGTAIYLRNPVGKIGEEFMGWMDTPLEMLRKKEGTIARPLLQIFANDKGFGRKVYDPNTETYMDKAAAIWAMVEHFGKAQTPEGSINAVSDLVRGEGDPKTNALQAGLPFVGMTVSKGAPGGPAAGEMYDYRQRHDVKVNMALPDIRKQILRGDLGGAMQRMRELDIPPGLQRFYLRTTLDPSTRVGGRTLRDFYLSATPEQRERLERARQ